MRMLYIDLRRRAAVTALLAATLAVAGCGGGGGSAPAGTGRVGVFITDSFREDFSQVWVTVTKVEIGDDRAFHTLFDDSAGKTINVAALSHSSQLIGMASVPAGAFSRARVTIEDHLRLVPRGGSGAGDRQVDDSAGIVAGGLAVITLPINARIDPGLEHNLVIDFDLASFQMVGTAVRPHLRHGADELFRLRAKRAELEGTVASLTAAGFDLVLAGGVSVPVVLGPGTTVFHSSTGAVAALSNGIVVEVKGPFDAASGTVAAAAVKLEDRAGMENHEDIPGVAAPAEAEGTVASVDPNGKTLVLTLREAEGFRPGAGTLVISAASAAVFDRRHSGSAVFGDIAPGIEIEAVGTFDSAAGILTAARIELR